MSWINRLKSSLGSKNADVEKKTIDVTSIRYSMPTVASDVLTFVVPTQASFEGAPQFHEDEWCQIEILPAASLKELQTTLAEYKIFEEAHRLQYGWSQIFSRRLTRTVLIEGTDAVDKLAVLFGTAPTNSPILTTTSRPLGQVESGFAIKPLSDVLLYGVADERGITALGAMVQGDDRQLSQVFAKLHSSFGFMLVDWRQQLALCSVGLDGNFAIWRP
ncbi:hypothetical protein [Luteibacter sp. dw_328]|uniref:hypothetical protein n=1 Tax=Luteibacter sp. dw_328 TaxID=2719796 RepID=UPI001BD67BA5|nr:hypothetical protein [Luteibacter sp. dw_328]